MHAAALVIAETIQKNPLGAYFVIYLAVTLFGNIAAFVSLWIIFAANLGPFGLLAFVLAVFLADTSADILWFSLGQSLRDTRFGLWVETHIPGHAKAAALFQSKGRKWLVFSKFVLGFAPPVVFSIGWSGMDFKTFYKNSLLATILWLPVLLGISYAIISGLTPLAASDFRRIEWVVLCGFVLFIALDYVLAKGIKLLARRFIETGD
jgi:membrane protein DedA with SNARE-associated domain